MLLKSNLENLNELSEIHFWEKYHDFLYKKEVVSTFEDAHGKRFVGRILKVTFEGKLKVQLENDLEIDFDDDIWNNIQYLEVDIFNDNKFKLKDKFSNINPDDTDKIIDTVKNLSKIELLYFIKKIGIELSIYKNIPLENFKIKKG